MLRKPIQVCEAVDRLNEAIMLDENAINELFSVRVKCNSNLAGHPTIQVGRDEDNNYTVGLLGIINGIFGVDEKDWGFLAAEIENGRITKFIELK